VAPSGYGKRGWQPSKEIPWGYTKQSLRQPYKAYERVWRKDIATVRVDNNVHAVACIDDTCDGRGRAG
jgi:hypothetical protein